MARTAMWPIPSGRVSRIAARAFGVVLLGSAVAARATALNIKGAALLAFTIFFAVVVCTVWLKRPTSQNIVNGGASGALPTVSGWAASTAKIGPLSLFSGDLPVDAQHFWASSLNLIPTVPCPNRVHFHHRQSG